MGVQSSKNNRGALIGFSIFFSHMIFIYHSNRLVELILMVFTIARYEFPIKSYSY